jgi:hypothetical protein
MRRNVPAGNEGVDVDAIVDRLTGTGLLMEVSGPVEEFARAVRLLPQAVGLGNGALHSRTFTIGFPGSPLAAVPTEVFYVWSWACLEPDLWTACVRATASASPFGTGDPREVAVEVLAHLHVMLSANVASLDTAAVTA